MKEVEELQKRLDYQFEDKNLIIEALTHKSYKQSYNNERLEFLGDAVLDLVVGEYLYKKFSATDEGNLSKMRASLVNEKGFEKLAINIGLGDMIFISQAEENNGGRKKASLLSNAFEAVMGAFYLEAGLERVREFMENLLESSYKDINIKNISHDYKTSLQELTQARFGVTPDYKMLRSFGPDHRKEFEIEVSVASKYLAKAKGKSKKDAQQKAARKALNILEKEKL